MRWLGSARFFATVFLGSGLLFVGMLFVASAVTAAFLTDVAARAGMPQPISHFDRRIGAIVLHVYVIRMAPGIPFGEGNGDGSSIQGVAYSIYVPVSLPLQLICSSLLHRTQAFDRHDNLVVEMLRIELRDFSIGGYRAEAALRSVFAVYRASPSSPDRRHRAGRRCRSGWRLGSPRIGHPVLIWRAGALLVPCRLDPGHRGALMSGPEPTGAGP